MHLFFHLCSLISKVKCLLDEWATRERVGLPIECVTTKFVYLDEFPYVFYVMMTFGKNPYNQFLQKNWFETRLRVLYLNNCGKICENLRLARHLSMFVVFRVMVGNEEFRFTDFWRCYPCATRCSFST